MSPAKSTETILIVCIKPKCPRTKRTPRQEYDPPSAVRMAMLCPWHSDSGNKEEEVVYYASNGREIAWNPDWK